MDANQTTGQDDQAFKNLLEEIQRQQRENAALAARIRAGERVEREHIQMHADDRAHIANLRAQNGAYHEEIEQLRRALAEAAKPKPLPAA